MIPYSSLPHGYGYFSDPYSSISINAAGGGGGNGAGGGYSDYNGGGFNQARVHSFIIRGRLSPDLRPQQKRGILIPGFVLLYLSSVGTFLAGLGSYFNYFRLSEPTNYLGSDLSYWNPVLSICDAYSSV